MRTLSVLLLLNLVSLPVSSADDVSSQINKACLRHAVSLVARLKADVIGGMTQEQSDQALKLASQYCQAYFNREFGQNPVVVRNENANEETSKKSGDWFNDQIIQGGGVEKNKGHERLQRR